jgi:DNA-binding IclR family transcriptional regulator
LVNNHHSTENRLDRQVVKITDQFKKLPLKPIDNCEKNCYSIYQNQILNNGISVNIKNHNIPKYPVETIFKASAILEALGESNQEMGIKALSEKVGLSASAVHRMLDTLVTIGYVQRNEGTHQYRLGIGLFQIGMRVLSQYGMNPDVRVVLEELAGTSGETAKLGAQFNGKMIYLGLVESSNLLRFTGHVGSWAPLHCTAMGKIMLAALSKADQEANISRLMPLKKFTNNTLTDMSQLIEYLDVVNTQGYAVDDEEFLVGSRGIACPVKNSQGQVIAAVSISGPSARLTLSMLLSYLPLVQDASEKLSQVIIS